MWASESRSLHPWDLALVKATKVVKEFILGRTQETMNWLNAKNA